ncbi:PH domain-containing protein, partial [Streptococcus suis]
MGIISGFLGKASQLDYDKIEQELEHVLLYNEQVEMEFSMVRDLIVFTEYRFILVDKQGMTGKKV